MGEVGLRQSNNINNIQRQPGLTARIERKGISGALANFRRGAARGATPRPSEQVFTSTLARSHAEALSDQQLTEAINRGDDVLDTILVIQHPSVPPAHSPTATRQRSRNGKRRKRRGRRGRGGWRFSPGLTWREVQRINSIDHEVERGGFKFTHLISIMPAAGDDMERKRECALIVAHLGQALKRHGKLHIGLTVYEKSAGGDLHAHHLVHIPKSEVDLVERLHDRPKIDVTRITTKGIIGYITKERRPREPEFEARVAHVRKKAAQRIPGKRWTATSAAVALIEPTQTTRRVGGAS